MGTPSPKYTAEFKQKAVELYRKSGTKSYVRKRLQSRTITQIATDEGGGGRSKLSQLTQGARQVSCRLGLSKGIVDID